MVSSVFQKGEGFGTSFSWTSAEVMCTDALDWVELFAVCQLHQSGGY